MQTTQREKDEAQVRRKHLDWLNTVKEGKTVRAFAKDVGISPRTLYAWSSRGEIPLSGVVEISVALNLNITDQLVQTGYVPEGFSPELRPDAKRLGSDELVSELAGRLSPEGGKALRALMEGILYGQFGHEGSRDH